MSEFEKIINEAIERAEAVECDFADFVEGLAEMRELVIERLECAKSELAERGSS